MRDSLEGVVLDAIQHIRSSPNDPSLSHERRANLKLLSSDIFKLGQTV